MHTREELIEKQLKQVLMTRNQKRKMEFKNWEEQAKGKHKSHQF